jgi:spore coat polysaccharide biosynthesis protein SpsF
MHKQVPFALIVVRNSSKRLPAKALLPLVDSKNSIDIICERLKKTGLKIVICTSTHDEDSVFEEIARKNKVLLFRGDLHNKIRRWKACFDHYNITSALLVDGDDLLYDYELGIKAIAMLEQYKDLELIRHPEDIVCGLFTYAVSARGIDKLYKVAADLDDTDVITEILKRAKLKEIILETEAFQRNKNMRLTLDYEEDLLMFRTLFKHLDYLANAAEIVDFYDKNNTIFNINWFRMGDFKANQEKFNAGVKKILRS